jgi:hypothetical protein
MTALRDLVIIFFIMLIGSYFLLIGFADTAGMSRLEQRVGLAKEELLNVQK